MLSLNLNFVRSMILTLSAFSLGLISRQALSASFGLELDLSSTLYKLAKNTNTSDMSVSVRYYPAAEWHIGLDRIYDDETDGGGSCTDQAIQPGGLSYCQAYELNIPTKYIGPSVGYYFDGFDQDSWVGTVSAGHAKRTFIDANLGKKDYSGTYRAAEFGYQWRLKFGTLGLSYRLLNSNLETNSEFKKDQAVIKYSNKNSKVYIKTNLTVLF